MPVSRCQVSTRCGGTIRALQNNATRGYRAGSSRNGSGEVTTIWSNELPAARLAVGVVCPVTSWGAADAAVCNARGCPCAGCSEAENQERSAHADSDDLFHMSPIYRWWAPTPTQQ